MESKSIPKGCFSFLKPLMEDDYSKEIRIPHAFARNHGNKLLRKCELLGNEANSSWIVKIRRKGRRSPRYYMCNGEWSDFVKFYDLKYGDYLLFFLIDQATFKVIPYGADCCQKLNISCYDEFDLPSISDSSDDDDSSSSEESEEDDDIDISKKQPLRNEQNKRHKVGSRVGRSPPRNEQNKKRRFDSRAGRSNGSQNLKKLRNSACRTGSHIDLKAENPFCIVTLYRHNDRYMTIPRPFVRGTQIEQKKTAILHGEDERVWEVEIHHRSGRVDMVKGWPDFFKGYDLKEGDSCKFTQLKVSGNVLKVEITRKLHP